MTVAVFKMQTLSLSSHQLERRGELDRLVQGTVERAVHCVNAMHALDFPADHGSENENALLATPNEAAKRVPGADSGHVGRRRLLQSTHTLPMF